MSRLLRKKLDTVLCLAVTTGRTVRELLGVTAAESRVTAGNTLSWLNR